MLVQHGTPTTFGKLSTGKNSTPWSKTTKPLFRAFKYILSPCISNTLLNVVVDQSISGLLGVKTADKLMKLMKAHCLPLDCSTQKRSSP